MHPRPLPGHTLKALPPLPQDVFGDGASKELIKRGHQGGPQSHVAAVPRRRRNWDMAVLRKDHLRTERTPASLSQGERPSEKPTLPAPCSQTPSLQNWEEMYFCCSSHPACGTLLWQHQRTATLPFSKTPLSLKFIVSNASFSFMGKCLEVLAKLPSTQITQIRCRF